MSIGQGIGETIFDSIYLTSAILVGLYLIKISKNNNQCLLFGIMSVILGVGDSFHLIPRCYALLTDGLNNHLRSIGIGKLITSITMTIFYLLLYHILILRYPTSKNNFFTIIIYIFAIIIIILCFHSQNLCTSPNQPLSWGIYRNIPFALMGLIIIILYYIYTSSDFNFKYMWLAITLSFLFYIPVVLWAHIYPIIGALMIPKTFAYIWVVYMGYKEFTK